MRSTFVQVALTPKHRKALRLHLPYFKGSSVPVPTRIHDAIKLWPQVDNDLFPLVCALVVHLLEKQHIGGHISEGLNAKHIKQIDDFLKFANKLEGKNIKQLIIDIGGDSFKLDNKMLLEFFSNEVFQKVCDYAQWQKNEIEVNGASIPSYIILDDILKKFSPKSPINWLIDKMYVLAGILEPTTVKKPGDRIRKKIESYRKTLSA